MSVGWCPSAYAKNTDLNGLENKSEKKGKKGKKILDIIDLAMYDKNKRDEAMQLVDQILADDGDRKHKKTQKMSDIVDKTSLSQSLRKHHLATLGLTPQHLDAFADHPEKAKKLLDLALYDSLQGLALFRSNKDEAENNIRGAYQYLINSCMNAPAGPAEHPRDKPVSAAELQCRLMQQGITKWRKKGSLKRKDQRSKSLYVKLNT